MPEIEYLNEETLETEIYQGTHLGVVLVKLEIEASALDFKSTELESQLIANSEELIYFESEFKSVSDVEKAIKELKKESRIIYGVINRIKEAIKKDSVN